MAATAITPPLVNSPDEFDTLEGDAKILAIAKKRFQQVQETTSEIRREAVDDINFRLGNQWPEKSLKERAADDRPTIVVNRVHGTINQIVNAGKTNRPSPKVRGVDDSSDKDTAEVIAGLLRHIQYNSDSEAAFDTGFDHAVSGGFGFWRILTEYASEDSFDQDIKIDRIGNQFQVYFPFNLCKKLDYSDVPYCFITDDVPKEEFAETYPDIDMSSWPMSAEGDISWYTQDTVKVAEYYDIVEEKKTKYLLSDGSIVDSVENLPEGTSVVKKRSVKEKKVMWYKLCPSKIIDKKEVVFNRIPVIAVIGAEICNQGKKTFVSITRFAKDPQRMINYWKSAFTEMVALQPRAPYIGAAGQFAGYEQLWAASNKKNIAYLEYRSVDALGNLAGKPERQPMTQIPNGIVEGIRESIDDYKATTMMFDASLGSAGNETSGRAIRERKNQGEVSNFHFFDNLTRAVRLTMKIIVDAIPKVIDTDRAVRILGEDMREKVVKVQQGFADPDNEIYDLSAGKYDVIMDNGPTYATAKAESADYIMQMIQGNPNLAGSVSDLLAKYLDMPTEIVDRLKKTLPPGLAEEEKGQGQIPPQLMQQMQEMQQQLQMVDQIVPKMEQEIQTLQQQLATKDKEIAASIERTKIQAKAAIDKTMIQHGHDVGMSAMQQEHETRMKIDTDKLSQLVEMVTNIAQRVDGLESVATNSPAPVQPAG